MGGKSPRGSISTSERSRLNRPETRAGPGLEQLFLCIKEWGAAACPPEPPPGRLFPGVMLHPPFPRTHSEPVPLR